MSATGIKSVAKSAINNALSPLSHAEGRELGRCEEIISKGWDTFIAVGQALARIRDQRLYRAEFHTFEAYCFHKWYYRRAHAYRLIGAAEVIRILSPIGDISLPRNEAQVRPLLGLKPDEVQTVWRKVLATASKRPITADLVKHAVAEFKHHADPKRPPPEAGGIPDEVARVVLNADKLMSKIKRSIKAADLKRTIMLIHELRETLRFESPGNAIETR